jgi:hypothetical protein
MLLVPRQLLRSGMTGNVPYYGGRFSPAQAYAACHLHRVRHQPAEHGVGQCRRWANYGPRGSRLSS